MNQRLLEEINRFKLLSSYDTRKTLTEQEVILTEQGKGWKVMTQNGEPFAMVGPNGEFKGGNAEVTNYNQLMTWYRNQEPGTAFFVDYNKNSHSGLFQDSQVTQAPGQPSDGKSDIKSLPVLVGDQTKVGQINLSGSNGVGQFKNGSLFSFYGANDTIILGKFTEVESFSVPTGSKEITVTGEKTTPAEYKVVSIALGDKVISDPFLVGQSTLKDEAKLKLDKFVESVNEFKTSYGDEAFTKYIEFLNSQKPINVDGYASRDSDPNKLYRSGKTAEQADKELSQARAQVIVNYLETAIPEMKGILTAVGNGQTDQFGGVESGWRSAGPNDPTKFGVNRRFVINIPDFSYDKSELVSPETTQTWSKQETDKSGVRPTVKDERGRPIRMGTAATSGKSIESEFASQNEIDLANKMYETDLGNIVSADLAGTKLKHYKDPNGFFIVSKEEMEKIKDYIPIMTPGSFNGSTNPVTTVTSTSVSLEANGKTYVWNGWTQKNSEDDGVSYQYVTASKLVATQYRSSGGKLIDPDGYLLGKVGFGLRKV
jgi:outer membrane protein OmpA-like peptidoglycan-associated protein